MDLAKYKQAQEDCAKRAQYYELISFPIIAGAFREAAVSLKEMIELLEKLQADPAANEEGVNE